MKRRFPVTLTLSAVLFLSAWNVLRAWTSIVWNSVLTEFSARLAPTASAVIGAVWAGIGILLFWGIWQKKAWAGKMLIGAAAGYTVWYWSERLFLQNPRPNLLFAVIINLGLLVVIFFSAKSISREAYEQNIEYPKAE